MSDTSPKNQEALRFGACGPKPRQPVPGELLFEFFVERAHRFYRCELRDHGAYGVEAQFFDPVELVRSRMFPPQLDPLRTPREMAIVWAELERDAILRER